MMNSNVAEILLWEKIAVGICVAMCLGVLGLFIDKAYFFISHYHTSNPQIKIKCLWLVGIYPVSPTLHKVMYVLPCFCCTKTYFSLSVWVWQ